MIDDPTRSIRKPTDIGTTEHRQSRATSRRIRTAYIEAEFSVDDTDFLHNFIK